jgi:hypothetical protein
MLRFVLNLVVLLILIRLIYYKYSKKEEYVFTYFMMGIVIFLLTSLLGTVDIQIGVALGLFAIFAILRFRTVNFTVKDMTYMFTVIGVSVINSQANVNPPIFGALGVNFIVIAATFILEAFLFKNSHTSHILKYGRTELLHPARRSELIQDLNLLTGYKIEKVTIIEVDAVKNNAEIEVWYKA